MEAAKPPPPTGAEGSVPSVARRLALYQRAGGVVTPLITALLAFLMGGIVVAVTGHNPLTTYRDIFRGTGLEWLIPGFGDRATLATNLQQTLIITTTLTLTGLAVAFAFRCGMFNIGGQGQFFAGQYVAVIVGSSWAGLAGPAHIFLAITLAALAGAVWAGIAGFLKATVGAHEVISTIMLNWIAIWMGQWMFGLGGPLHSSSSADQFNPVSSPIVDKVKLPVFWGDPLLQGLHVGFFIAIGALVVYWVTLNRTTLGYEVRAVGFNPEAARYGGISVRRNYILAMAISGTFAGLAGAIDILGWQFQLATATILTSDIGFIGIAVALLGRNTAVGTFIGALVFGALYTGTSTRNLTSGFDPRLAGNLAKIIQGLVVLFIGADLLVLYVWNARKRLRLPQRTRAVS
jgi:general nucleoside transport system permease protein